MTLALMAVRQEVNNFESYVVVQELEFAMITTGILTLPQIPKEHLSASGQKLKGTQSIGKLPQLG